MNELKTKRERADKIVELVTNFARSRINVVIFKDTPEVWAQFYLGLYLGMPTVVEINKKDLPLKTMMNKYPLVKKILEVEERNDESAKRLGDILYELNKSLLANDK